MHLRLLGVWLTASLLLGGPLVAAEPYDLLIRGGTVLDGTGAPRYAADVAVSDGVIVKVGKLDRAQAQVTLDARGLYVAPGFINIHDHPEPNAVAKAANMLTQGVTTEIGNPDGQGVSDLNTQFANMSAGGLATNLGLYIGFNWVWAQVMGVTDQRPTDAEMADMQARIVQGLTDGAWGVSAGLDYKPGYFARFDEVVKVLSVARPWRTNFPNHERLTPETGYSSLTGVEETVRIGAATGLMPVLTHMKSQGIEQGKAGDILKLMDESQKQGIYVAGDIYPYTYGFNNVRSLLIPAWAMDGGEDALYARFKDPETRKRIIADIEQVMLQRWNGPKGVYVLFIDRELTDLMTEWGVGAGEAIIRLNEQNRGKLPLTYLRFGIDDDVVAMMLHPNVSVSCDCGALLPVLGHPRAFGTFPAVLGKYVRERNVMSWEEAVRKMTGLPAATIGMVDRGFIAPGMAADIAVFDPVSISDRGTDTAPQLSTGMRHVIVNGRLALKDGAVTGNLAGAVVKRSVSMPSRPFTPRAQHRVSGTVTLVQNANAAQTVKLDLDVRQSLKSKTASGRLSIKDEGGRVIFSAVDWGIVQTARGWASVTGMGRDGQGRHRAFRLIVDRADNKPDAAPEVELTLGADAPFVANRAANMMLTQTAP